jgi:hypothetical protein
MAIKSIAIKLWDQPLGLIARPSTIEKLKRKLKEITRCIFRRGYE